MNSNWSASVKPADSSAGDGGAGWYMISETTRLAAEAGSTGEVFSMTMEAELISLPLKSMASRVTVREPGLAGTLSCHVLLAVHVTLRGSELPAMRMLRTLTQPVPVRVAVLPLTLSGPGVVMAKAVCGMAERIWVRTLFDRFVM